MFVILWEYEVKPGCEEMFETVYGPQGGWARLFQSDSHYRDTRLLRDVSQPRFYFTLDYWDTEQSFEAFHSSHQAVYADLDRSSAGLTISERRLAAFALTSGDG